MGRRTTVSAACLVLLGGLATSCTTGPSDAEIDEWLETRDQAIADDAVGAMAAAIRTPVSDAADEPAATLHIGEPSDVSGVRVECLGDQELLVSVKLTSGDDERAVEVPVECADGRHEEPLAFPGALSIHVAVFGDGGTGAVRVDVLGEAVSPG